MCALKRSWEFTRQRFGAIKVGLNMDLADAPSFELHRPRVSYKRVAESVKNLGGSNQRFRLSYKRVLLYDDSLKPILTRSYYIPRMNSQKLIRVACYLRVSTETQELDNQRQEILPFIERRNWQLVQSFEDVMSGRKSEKDRPGFASMLKAAHQRKFDILVFWALDRLTREN